MQQTENKKSEGRFSSELFGWGESLMAVLVFFVVVFTFFVRLIGVDGMSMYPTLEDHSIMLVSNLNYTPERGDVVVLRKEGFTTISRSSSASLRPAAIRWTLIP